MTGVDESVEQGFRDDGVREQRIPINWGWHTFVWAQMWCDLLILAFGVSAGFRGASAVC